VNIIAPAENFLKEFGFKLTPALLQAKWVRRPFADKTKRAAEAAPRAE